MNTIKIYNNAGAHDKIKFTNSHVRQEVNYGKRFKKTFKNWTSLETSNAGQCKSMHQRQYQSICDIFKTRIRLRYHAY